MIWPSEGEELKSRRDGSDGKTNSSGVVTDPRRPYWPFSWRQCRNWHQHKPNHSHVIRLSSPTFWMNRMDVVLQCVDFWKNSQMSVTLSRFMLWSSGLRYSTGCHTPAKLHGVAGRKIAIQTLTAGKSPISSLPFAQGSHNTNSLSLLILLTSYSTVFFFQFSVDYEG